MRTTQDNPEVPSQLTDPHNNDHSLSGAPYQFPSYPHLDIGGTSNEAHSPFLNNMLRFSPKSHSSHISPLHRRLSQSSRNRAVRFFPKRAVAASTSAADPMIFEDTNATFNAVEDTHPPNNHDSALVDGIPIYQLRALAKQSLLSTPIMASYFSGLLFAKTSLPQDALVLAQAHCTAGKYEASLRILEEAQLLQLPQQDATLWDAVLIAAQALSAKRDWNSLLDMMEDVCRVPDASSYLPNTSTARGLSFHSLAASQPIEDHDQIGWQSLKRVFPVTTLLHPLALLCWYRGLAFHETGCTSRAATYWKLALQLDPQCQQAWESVLEKNLLTTKEAYDWLIQEVPFTPEQDWLRSLYLARIELTTNERTHSSARKSLDLSANPFDGGAISMAQLPLGPSLLEDASSIQLSSPLPSFPIASGIHASTLSEVNEPNHVAEPSMMQKDVDTAFHKLWNQYGFQNAPQILAMAARRAYRRYDWKAALALCQELAHLDPAVEDAAFCYVSTLVLLGHKRVLFRLAHAWVDAAPQSAASWFAVGAYYYSIQRYHMAQRHFCRATRLNPQCTEAWIAFGCSFAACDESDQALASFRAAQRLSPGEHSSLLYMGMEYIRTNHLVLASHFLQTALAASGGDPLCFHEMGVLAAHRGDHAKAIYLFRLAIQGGVGDGSDAVSEHLDLCHDTYWEPTIFNLGHSYRKCRQFDLAVICFRRCVALCPDAASAYSAVAFTLHLMGDVDEAISHYHRALGIKPDDPFSTDMLNRALHDQLTSASRIFDAGDSPPQQSTLPWDRSGKHYTSDSSAMDVDLSANSFS
jgi:tetratricopeptide (TPR) repeat protein